MKVTIRNPVIVIPGITASELRDDYDLDPSTVWTLFTKNYERVALHPDNLRLERDEPARVREDRVFGVPYKELIEELRHDLSDRADQPTPVFPFAYDWRQPLEAAELALEGFVDEVIERAKLLPHYHKAGYRDDPKVDLVGHSMGGLIIAGYLARKGANARVSKVVTIGSPFRGSLEAPLKITTGLADLGLGIASSREREVARLTPALYYLLPSFEGALQTPPTLPNDLYEPNAWQPSVVETIAEYIRLYGLEKTDRKARAETLFTDMLKRARANRDRLESLSLKKAGLTVEDWLCIVGVNETTRVRLRILDKRGKPEFVLESKDRENKWGHEDPARAVLTGDGTVPYLGSRSSFIPVEKIVCVTDDDFGYWELRDRLFEAAGGLHGLLPKMNLVHRLIVSHFRGEPRRGTWGRRPPDLPAAAAWEPPIKGLPEKL